MVEESSSQAMNRAARDYRSHILAKAGLKNDWDATPQKLKNFYYRMVMTRLQEADKRRAPPVRSLDDDSDG